MYRVPRLSLLWSAPIQRVTSTGTRGWCSKPVFLKTGTTKEFKDKAFGPQLPALFPTGHFIEIPAVGRWFESTPTDSNASKLNDAYLRPHGDTMVPLEYSWTGTDEDSFQRVEGALSSFLDWMQSADLHSSRRIYLAQAPISDLPPLLKGDVPAPDPVLKGGRGDVYDTSIWIGCPPTYTPLHRDPNPNLFVQLAGTKRVRLFPPDKGAQIFEDVQERLGMHASAIFRGDEMMQGKEKTLLEHEVWGIDRGDAVNVEVKPGDGLFIPKGWWHSIKGTGDGVTGSVNWWFR